MTLWPRLLLRVASFAVPSPFRAEWRREWESELYYVPAPLALRFCLGAFRDAWWMRRNHPLRPGRWLESPAACLGLLAALGAVTLFAASGRPGLRLFPVLVISSLLSPLALLGLPATCPRWHRGRWLGFLAAKIALLLPLIYFGTICLAASAAPKMQPHGLLIGYVFGLRWALTDQRRRCPECLRLLDCEARIGSAGNLLLDWFGTELACPRGHALLQMPGTALGSYSSDRWLRLDETWRTVFRARA